MINRIIFLLTFVVLFISTLSLPTTTTTIAKIHPSKSSKLQVEITLQSIDDNHHSSKNNNQNVESNKYIIHYTCFGVALVVVGLDNSSYYEYNKEQCCEEIIVQRSTMIEGYNIIISNEYCQTLIATLPLLSSSTSSTTQNRTEDDVSSSLLVPLFYFNMEESLSPSQVKMFQSSIMNDTNSHHHGYHLYSPFYYDQQYGKKDNEHNILLEESRDEIEDYDKGSSNTFSAILDSSLSSEGGMHRPFIHNLTISIQQSQLFGRKTISKLADDVNSASSSINSNISVSGDVVLFLPIGKEYFLDLDDPFQNDTKQACQIQSRLLFNHDENILPSQCQIEVMTNPNTVIDIEQPSFSSKLHVVGFRILYDTMIPSFILKENTMIDPSSLLMMKITFVPMIHLRYQEPILWNQVNTSRFQSTRVLNAFLYDGTISSILERDDYDDKNNIIIDTFVLHPSQQMNRGVIETISVASGLDYHHDIVMITTMIACILGSIQMIRDLSKVSRWY